MRDLDQQIRAELVNNYGDNEDKFINALTGVLDLHQPDENGNCIPCNVATYGPPLAWPCPTVHEIADPLGAHIKENSMADLDQTIRNKLDELAEDMAVDNDRSLEEFRDRYPEYLAGIDALRAVLNQIGQLDWNMPALHAQTEMYNAAARALGIPEENNPYA